MSLLHIGDIISLYSNGFLSTLGLVDDRCVVPDNRRNSESQTTSSPKDPPKKFRDCLFKVCFQHKYDIQNELWRSSHIDEELYKKLYRAARQEQETNQEKNQLKRGTVVKYEDTIQLLHIKSNKYVTVNAKAAAPVEQGAIRVYLDSTGNEGSWFKVKSPYKYRSIGEDVVCESIALVSDILGTLNQEEALYLHASSYYLSDNPECLEVNAFRQSTSWDVKPFLDYTEDLEEFLKGGDVVRLFHTDQEKFLTLDTYNDDHNHYVFLRSTDRAKATSATSSKALWEVEVVHPDPCRASVARWNSLIRLKHLATERFLAADRDDDPTPDPMRERLRDKGAVVYKLISIEFSYDYAMLFEFDSTTMNVNGDAYIPIHSNITLKHHPTGTYVHSTKIYIDKDKKKSCMSKVGCAQNKGLDEVFAVIPVSATEIRDLDFVYDACVLLNETHDLIKEDLHCGGRAEAHRKLVELLAEIIHFIANKESEPRKLEKALTMVAENPNRERQKLLREQNVLKLLFDILELEDALEINRDTCRLCYRVLLLSFQDYRKNQEYIVFWAKFMQRQFGKDIFAEITYSSLFNSNKNLLEKSVELADVNVFIDLIRTQRKSEFLDCLADLCITADGSVSGKTQRLIFESILDETNSDILIETLVQQTEGFTNKTIWLSTNHWMSAERDDLSSNVPIVQVCKPLHEIIRSSRAGNLDDRFMLNYYRHQLDLFSAICVGRQMKAIDILAERLSLRLIQSCIRDSELPCELRASFCRLLLHLHIIRDPQKLVSPVNLKRQWQDIAEKVDVEIYDCHDHVAPNEKFNETMEFVEMYLSDLTAIPSRSIFSNISRNKLTFEVINLNRELTYFGFYKLSDFLRLAEVLLIVLEDDKTQHKLVMKTKTKIIETLQYMSDVRLDYMLTSLLAIFKSNQQLGRTASQQHYQQTIQQNSSATITDSTTQNNTSTSPSSERATRTTAPTLSTPNGFSSLSSQTAISAIRTDHALDKHLSETNLDHSQGRKFINVLLHLVKHDCHALVSASLRLLLNYRSQRQRVLETFRQVEFVGAAPEIEDNFRKLHPLIERSDKYIRKGRDENHRAVNEVLIQNSKLISYIVQHIQYLIKNKDEKSLTKDLLKLLRDLVQLDLTVVELNARQPKKSRTAAATAIAGRVIGRSGGAAVGGGNVTVSKEGAGGVSRKTSCQQALTISDIQNRLDAHGASNLCVELIAMCSVSCEEKVRDRSAAVFKDTLKLAIALLDGGNQTIQASIYERLTRKSEQEKSERFFEVLATRMVLAQQALSPTTGFASGSEWSIESRLILRFLQLLCEDHNSTMQNYLHSQTNKTSYNLVAKTLVFLNCICGSKEGSLGLKLGEYIKEHNVDLINQTLHTLIEYCQGPCVENQRCILMHESNGIDMIRSLILDSIEPLYSLRMDLVLELKDNASKLLLALMESCSDPMHAARILREPSLTKKLINVSITYYHEQDDYDDTFAGLSLEETPSAADGIVMPRDVGHKVFILCHQLVQQYNMIPALSLSSPSSSSFAKIPTSDEASLRASKCDSPVDRENYSREATALRYYESHTAQIEIVRASRRLERVVFPVPQICEYLTHETKTNVFHHTEQDERGSKIPNFFLIVDNLFEEMKWQRELQTKPILHSIARYMSLWSALEFKLSFLVTVLVLFCVTNASFGDNGGGGGEELKSATTSQTMSSVVIQQQRSFHEAVVAATTTFATTIVNNISNNALPDNMAKSTMVQEATATEKIALVGGGASSSSTTSRRQAQSSSSNFFPSLLSTFLAIALSTFFVFKPRIRHSWSIFLVCATLYLSQVVGQCVSLKILGLFLEAVTIMHLLSVLINNGIVNKQAREIAFETDVLFHGGYLLVCTMGLLLNPLFYPFLLPPSLICREETLRNVIKSFTKNAYSILMTGFLGLTIILLYTIITHTFFPQDFVIEMDDGLVYEPCVETLLECFVAHVNYGLRDGGGIGERIRDVRLFSSPYNIMRICFVVSYFLVVSLLLLQLVYCIIVDSFATLRSDKQHKEEILRNTCFVCGLERSSFENRQVTFEDHIQFEHNIWHYLYFIVLIKIKSRTELSGPESFVHDMIKDKDHSWFPRMRAISQP